MVLLDQLTKAWVVANHSYEPLSIIGTNVEFRVARNSGGAFSTFTNATIVLARPRDRPDDLAGAHAARARPTAWTVVALSFVLGGALGNLCDRIFRSPGVLAATSSTSCTSARFPSFNVADSAITIGAILLIVLSFRKPEPRAATPVPSP